MTRCPSLVRVPQNSRPATSGGFGAPGYPPCADMMSAKLMPPASTSINSCPDVGTGSGTVRTSSTSGSPKRLMTRAFMSSSVAAAQSQFTAATSRQQVYTLRIKVGGSPFWTVGKGEVGALFHIQFIGSALQITGTDFLETPGNQCGTLMRGGVRARVPGRCFGGLGSGAVFICSH